MKTNDLINNLRERRAEAKALRVFHIILTVIFAAGIIFLICVKQWSSLLRACAIIALTIGAAAEESRIIDLCTLIIDNATDDLDINLENAKKEEIE